MALNIISTVLTRYKADTSDQKKALKSLKGEELKRHKLLLKQTEQQNAKLDKQIETWAKVGAAIGGVVVATKALSAGLDTLQKNVSLRAATVGVSLESLRESTSGLVDDTRLLEFAAKAMNGTFKLSQEEMDQALQGALALRKTLGVDLATALDRTQKAITEGTTEPLKELGLVIKGPPNDTEEGLQAALSALNAEAESLGGNFSLAGDEIDQAATDLANAKDSIEESLGNIAIALAPAIQAMADLVMWTLRAHGALTDFLSGADSRTAIQQLEDSIVRQREQLQGFDPSLPITMLMERNLSVAEGQLRQLLFQNRQAEADRASAAAEQRSIATFSQRTQRQLAGQRGGPSPFDISGTIADPSARGGFVRGAAEEFLDPRGRIDLEAETNASRRRLAEFREFRVEVEGAQESLRANIVEFERLTRGTNMLEMVLGTPDEIDATAESLRVLGQGFDSLANAFGTGVDALITGSGSFADAFKNAIGESLRSMAVEMSIRAIREGAFGLGQLALGNFPAAAVHGKAALAFGAGALAAGVAARTLGAGSVAAPRAISAGAGAGAAGVGVAGTGPTNDNAGRSSQFILFDEAFASMSPRERQARFRKKARSSGFDVKGDVVVNG